jgi:ribosome maturation factor RimP
MLDVHELILGEYRLEISSPGIPRPLFYPSHYQRYLNHVVQIKLRQPLLGQRNFTGTIASASEEIVILMIQDTPQEFRISNIVKAFLTVERGEL